MTKILILAMQSLTDEFLPYLENWESSVAAREGFPNAVKSMMLLSTETRLDLKITGTICSLALTCTACICDLCFIILSLAHSFVELVQYLFTVPGVSAFLSNRICQDPLEKFFGLQRQRGRVNENPSVSEFLRNTQALRVIQNTCSNVRGNCWGSSESDGHDKSIDDTPLPKRQRRQEN